MRYLLSLANGTPGNRDEEADERDLTTGLSGTGEL